MNPIIVGLLAGYFAFFPHNVQAQGKAISKINLEQKITTELQKHDSWVEAGIETNYTRPKTKRVSLAQINEGHKLEQMETEGNLATYNPFALRIELRMDLRDPVQPLDHELWHAISEEGGILFSPEHTGPTRTEIDAYAQRIASRPEIVQLRPLLEKALMQKEAYALGDLHLDLVELISSMVDDISHSADSLKSLGGKMPLYAKPTVLSIINYISSERQLLQKPAIEIAKETKNALRSFLLLGYLHMDVIEQKDTLDSTQPILSVAKRYGYEIALHTLHIILQKITDFEIRALKKISVKRNFFLNPDEMIARSFDSFAKIYYGPPTELLFPVAKEDIAFYGRFIHNEEQTFSKLLSKNYLAQEMIRDGFGWKTVRKKLEYATSFSYKGISYTWPNASTRIRGRIPGS